jgi:hypothetical protein
MTIMSGTAGKVKRVGDIERVGTESRLKKLREVNMVI